MQQEKKALLKKALHPISTKKIQLLTTTTNYPMFYVTTDGAKRSIGEMAEESEHFVAVEDFKQIYLKGLSGEIKDLHTTVDGQ